VKDITRLDRRRCLAKLVAGNDGAARTMGLLGDILSDAIKRNHIHAYPRADRTACGRRKDFKLDDAGYRSLGKALEAAERGGEPWQVIAAIRLLALTGCRRGENLKLRRTEVDAAGRCLRCEDRKTGKGIRPLGEAALRLLGTSCLAYATAGRP
jgi:integrase